MISYYTCALCGYNWNPDTQDSHECLVAPRKGHIPFVKPLKESKVSNGTTVEVKRENFHKFTDLIGNQFNHGGDKYKLPGFEDREATDIISSVFGGETEFDWILGTMMKYLFRFKNFQREKDLLKICTYGYILWLKQGNHLKKDSEHDQDIKK